MAIYRKNLTRSGVINHLSFLLELIESQDWIKFKDTALPNPKVFRIISKSISECEEFCGMTLLHACVRYDPPVDLLEDMIKIFPEALEREDILGRMPLHVAAGSGASPPVTKLLTDNFPQACIIQDEDGMTPLHFACNIDCVLFEGDEFKPRSPPSLEAVRYLLGGSLDAVTLEDMDEMNAVEYAIMSNASLEVVNLLQRTMQTFIKKKTNIDDPTFQAHKTSAIPSIKVEKTTPSA